MPGHGKQGTDPASAREALWAHHHALLRDPHEIVAQWRQASEIDPQLLAHRIRGPWWDLLEETGLTLLVTREYEHLVMALSVQTGRPHVSYLHLPHPNGMAVDSRRQRVFIASTRNPNLIFDFAPCTATALGGPVEERMQGRLLPVQARYLPGCLYLHDLALIGGELYANAVGVNAIIRLREGNRFEPVWWPRCIDSEQGPRLDRNYLQLNSIAPGKSVAASYFSASAAQPSRRRPGHLNFPVDGRGVIFSGATREVMGTGLTRPHSARLYRGEVWVDNSGYGQVGRIVGGKFEPIVALPGWTRGLFFTGKLTYVATSRVIPRFRHYAPGLDPDHCTTGLHAIETATGRVLASLLWPNGNQIFAIEGIHRAITPGFPFVRPGEADRKQHTVFFSRGRAA